jgi:hypothetical protein
VRQVRVKENGCGGEPRGQGKDDVVSEEPGPGLPVQLADADPHAARPLFDPADRVIASDRVFREPLSESSNQRHHASGETPGSGFHGVASHGPDSPVSELKAAQSFLELPISFEPQRLNQARHVRLNLGPVPGGTEIGGIPLILGA